MGDTAIAARTETPGQCRNAFLLLLLPLVDDCATHNSGHDCTRHMVGLHFACLAWVDLLKRGRDVSNVSQPDEWCLCVEPINRHPGNM
jgi:hypothetical protein